MLATPMLGLRPATPIDLRGGALPAAAVAAIFVAYTAVAGHGDPMSIIIAAAVGGLGGSLSLIVHELGHARAARRTPGVHVVRIVLAPFGAATLLEGSYRSGRDQLRVALAGPVASVGFAMALFAAMSLPFPVAVRWAMFLLAFLNLGVALVAMLPMHPCDGYKILVGIAWMAVRSEQRARTVVRHFGVGLVCCDVISTAVLLAERPVFGAVVGLVAAGVACERRVARLGRLGFRLGR